jgi:Cu2+-exporting ATPase
MPKKLEQIKESAVIHRHPATDHKDHPPHHVEIFRRKFWVCLVLTLPILYYTNLFQSLFGYQAINFPGSGFIPPVLSTIIFFYGGWVFLKNSLSEIKERQIGMMTLIALAISTAYFYSIFAEFFPIGEPLYWELATLITIMLLGHWIEMKAVSFTEKSLEELAQLLPNEVEVIQPGGAFNKISLQELRKGDLVLIRPGGIIPADGLIDSGKSDINETMITGESRPIDKNKGDKVVAGSINGAGSLNIRVTNIGEETFLAGMMRLVKDAQESKTKTQLISNRAAFYLTIIAISFSLITLITWLLLGFGASFSIERMVTVLVIACPHALGLAIPLVAIISTSLAARQGFIIRQRSALEDSRNIKTVLFDKTGTLTKGSYGVTKIFTNQSIANLDQNRLLQIAASADAPAEHYIAKALVKEAENRHLPLLKISDFTALPGRGISAKLEGKEIFIGGQNILQDNQPKFSREFAGEGSTIIYVIVNNQFYGALALSDIIRPESFEAISNLKEMNIEIAMITGDSVEVAQSVAKKLHIDRWFAEILPAEKMEKVRELQREEKIVAMVGDGINDAPALTQSDIGIAIGAGTNIAIESADIILVKNDPRDIAKIITLSRASYRKMIQNLFWATGYNIIAIPLAAGVLYSFNILLQPAVGAIFMSLSTIIVSINALTLKKHFK